MARLAEGERLVRASEVLQCRMLDAKPIDEDVEQQLDDLEHNQRVGSTALVAVGVLHLRLGPDGLARG